MRIILYTGKGGVGKTSVAATTACMLAKQGKRVLIFSTDQAHSLSDSFEVKLGSEPTQIMENLQGIEVDAVKESEAAWKNMKDYIKRLLTSRAEGGIEAEELLVFPGLEELFSLFKLIELYESNQYDVILVDCAPTGETLSLLKFPEMFGDFVTKVLPMKKKATKYVGPVVEKAMKVPMPDDSVFDDIERLTDKLARLQTLMGDHKIVSIRIVTTPENIVIKEAKRNFACLHMFNYNVDAIIVNKVYPTYAMEGYFSKWMKLQEEGIREINESFTGLPIFQLELQKHELRSVERLVEVGPVLYQGANPIDVLHDGKIFEVEKEEDHYVMKIAVPNLEKSDFDLGQKGGEIILSIRNEQRRIALPEMVKGKEVASAKYMDGALRVVFEA